MSFFSVINLCIFQKIIFEEWTNWIHILWPLGRAKSNGSFNFVLSLKLEKHFHRHLKPLYFPCNSFSLHHTENLIIDSSIPWKNKIFFLFKFFFSQVNKILFTCDSKTPLTVHLWYLLHSLIVHHSWWLFKDFPTK